MWNIDTLQLRQTIAFLNITRYLFILYFRLFSNLKKELYYF